MTKSERLELIEKYRRGQLDGFELQRFEDQLGHDEVLKKELQLDIEMSEALDDQSDFNLFRKSIQRAEDKYFSRQPKSRTLYWRAAAAVGLLFVVAILIWQPFGAPSPEERFASSFEPYPAPTNLRGADLAEMDDDFMMGLMKYEEQDYERAIAFFVKTLDKDQSNYTAKFLLAVSHMAQKDFDSAEPILKELVGDSDHLFVDQARWYLGLLYLVDEDDVNDENSNPIFAEITNQGLLRKVEKLK